MDISTDSILKLILGSSGLLAVIGAIIAYRQLKTARHAHLFKVYYDALNMFDTFEIRAARHYVYTLVEIEYDKTTNKPIGVKRKIDEPFENEKWSAINLYEKKKDNEKTVYDEHKYCAELICRSFDKLGLLVREGAIPIELVSRFYGVGALRCWVALAPYIFMLRESRQQPGHLWEWENLVFRIIIKGIEDREDAWSGVVEHDGMSIWIDACKESVLNKENLRDMRYSPGNYLWKLRVWQQPPINQ